MPVGRMVTKRQKMLLLSRVANADEQVATNRKPDFRLLVAKGSALSKSKLNDWATAYDESFPIVREPQKRYAALFKNIDHLRRHALQRADLSISDKARGLSGKTFNLLSAIRESRPEITDYLMKKCGSVRHKFRAMQKVRDTLELQSEEIVPCQPLFGRQTRECAALRGCLELGQDVLNLAFEPRENSL